jgi:hypothetical protein
VSDIKKKVTPKKELQKKVENILIKYGITIIHKI